MISRRFLRIKIFQALYAYFQSDSKAVGSAEKELFLSLERMHDLYLYFLILGKELVHHSKLKMEDAKVKRLPSEEDLNPNQKFVDNQLFSLLENNIQLNKLVKEKKVSWDADQELVTKFLAHLRKHPIYVAYMSTRETSFEADQKFVVALYKKIIPEYDLMLSEIQDKSVYWGYDEMDFVLSMVLKTIKKMDEKADNLSVILPLYRDKKEDVQFVKELFRKTIADEQENAKMIAKKTKNWEIDRIAMVDILLMKMALTELLNFKSVPIKVTLNEYIDLSKWYSTPKSKVFVNGVLDKLVAELKANGKLKKMGRGLLEG
jgi:N utilization substance protein B